MSLITTSCKRKFQVFLWRVPRKRLSSQKSLLPSSEVAVCLRVKEARERIGLDQSEAARRLGVKVHVLSNIEKCRAPLRFDLALRFCRELFVNEEWLALGSVALLEEVLRGVSARNIEVDAWHGIFFRTPLDLQSHPVANAVPPRTLFSEAFHVYLRPVAEEISKSRWVVPRISFTPYDRPGLRAEFLSMFVDRWVQLIRLKSREMGIPQECWPIVESDFVDNITKAAMLIAFRSYGIATPFQSEREFEFLRVLMADESSPIGTLSGVREATFEGDKVILSEPLMPIPKRGKKKKGA